MFITIVMPVRNEARFILQTLMSLIDQDYPRDSFEIIVADGMSDDGTPEIVRRFAADHRQVRLLDNPKRLSGAGRNIGFCKGRGDVFLVIDGHCYIPDRNLLRNVVDCFQTSGADCLGRPQPLDPPSLGFFQRAVALCRGSWLGHGGGSLIYSNFEGFCSPVSNGAAYRKAVFEKVGLVDESFDAAEDVEFNRRVEQTGLTCYTSPRLKVQYYPRDSLKGLFRQMMRYGKGRHRFVSKHKEALTLNQLVPPFFVVGLALLLLSWTLYAAFGWLHLIALSLTALYLIYLMLLVIESLRIAIRFGMSFLPLVPLILVTVHCGLGLGFINEGGAGLRSLFTSSRARPGFFI